MESSCCLFHEQYVYFLNNICSNSHDLLTFHALYALCEVSILRTRHLFEIMSPF